MQKQVFIINGSGGVGKDTVCNLAAANWRVRNISSITPILTVAQAAGWNGVKTAAARRFLAELKEACTAFNDLSFCYCLEQYEAFLQSDDEILFVHIREPKEIERFRQAMRTACHAILVRRPALEQSRGPLGNDADDGVNTYQYDYVFLNDGTLAELPEKVQHFFCAILTE